MTFTETTVRPALQARATAPRLPARGDHQAWLQYWADELRRALTRVSATTPVEQPWDFEVEHAVRSAKMLHYHGAKVLRWKDAR